MPRRKTHAQFVAELVEANPDVEVLGAYVNGKTPVDVRCRTCGHEWSAWPNGLLSGRGGSECAKAHQRERGMEARIRRMAADGLVSEEDIALLRGWGFPFSDDELEKGRR